LIRESYDINAYYTKDDVEGLTAEQQALMVSNHVTNPRSIIEEELRKYDSETDETGKHPERVSVINIANETEHHYNIARIMMSELTYRGESTCLIKDGQTAIDGEAEHYIVVVNNENDIVDSPDEAFEHIVMAKRNAVNKTIKCIYFVLKKKGGRGITFAASDELLKDDQYKYMYCDAVYTMAGAGSSLESMIQTNRNCAPRPRVKTHTTYVLQEERGGVVIDIARDIEEYHILSRDIINDLRVEGSLAPETLFSPEIFSDITKSRVNDILPMIQGYSTRKSPVKTYAEITDLATRRALVAAGIYSFGGKTFEVYERDFWVKLDPAIHADILSSNRSIAEPAAKNYVESQGWAAVGTKYGRGVLSVNYATNDGNQHMPWTVESKQGSEAGTARHYMSNRGQKMGNVITILQASDGDYYLYFNRPADVTKVNIVAHIETESVGSVMNTSYGVIGQRNLPFDRADLRSNIEVDPQQINNAGMIFGPAVI
jgi:hypothetical protein